MTTTDHAQTRCSVLGARFNPRRIAVFRALYLGDMLCATPALRALRRRFPEAEITLIGLSWMQELVKRLPYIDRLVLFPGYPGILEAPYEAECTSRFLAEAWITGYDLALQLHGNGHISNGFVAALGARVTLGYRRGFDTRLTLSLPYNQDEHEVLRWLRLMGTLDAPTDDVRLECPTTPAEDVQAAALVAAAPASSGPLIALHPGAKSIVRQWPAERFAALADLLVERYDARIVLTGGANEQEISAAVRRSMRAPALDLAGQTDLGTFAAVLARLDLLVTNDTGASHLASATQTPSVILFGPSLPEHWAPLDRSRHHPVDAHALLGGQIDPALALRRLPVEPVLAACAAALEHQHARAGEPQALARGA